MCCASHPDSVALSQGSLILEGVAGEVVAAALLAADIPPQLRIRKPLHRILLRCHIPVADRIPVGAALILPARSPAVAARILAVAAHILAVAARILAVVLLILLARIPVAARIQVAVLLILLGRGPARIQAAVLLILLVRIPVVIQAQHHTSAQTRRRQNARRMPRKVISQGNTVPQPIISMPTLRTAISTPTSEAVSQIV